MILAGPKWVRPVSPRPVSTVSTQIRFLGLPLGSPAPTTGAPLQMRPTCTYSIAVLDLGQTILALEALADYLIGSTRIYPPIDSASKSERAFCVHATPVLRGCLLAYWFGYLRCEKVNFCNLLRLELRLRVIGVERRASFFGEMPPISAD
jgi:hypothetical protein